jgi:CubicO group peptidase (beta-lactamase class C family)
MTGREDVMPTVNEMNWEQGRDMAIDTSELTAVVERQMRDWKVPGMAVGILKDGEIETHGFGVSSIETGFPIRPDSLFQVGSISKVYTAMLVMRLVEEGKLDLGTPVVQYLPELKLQDADAQRSLTMRHLLTHTSGLHGDWFADFGWGDDTLDKAMVEVHTLRQIASPGEVWSYCNSGFYVAGAIVQQITEHVFERAISEMLFEPLDLDRSFYWAHEAIVYPVAVGHSIEPGKEPEVARRYPLPRNVNAAGGIISNVENLLRFASANMVTEEGDCGSYLSLESILEMQREQAKAAVVADYYGIGWAIKHRGGVKLIGHGGTTSGFQTYLTLVPEKNFAIAQLTNLNRGSAAYQRIEEWALEHFCGIRHERPETIRLSSEQLEQLTGQYEQPIHSITISVHNGGLRLDVVDHLPREIEKKDVTNPPKYARPISETDFIIEGGPDDGTHVDFILDDSGKPRFFRYHGRVSEPVND